MRLIETNEAIYPFDIRDGEFVVSAYDKEFKSKSLDEIKRKLIKEERLLR